MKSQEHRLVGDAATAGALVQLGDDTAEERFTLSYGDVVALSGDFFAADDLFRLAAIPGAQGTEPGTRDEIICALKVMAVDGAVVDTRFGPGGEFSDYRFTATAATTEVERRVRDRFIALATANAGHFVAPGPPATRSSHFDSAVVAYRHLHKMALDEVCQLGRRGGEQSRAMATEAAAQHYLTDAFAAGHLRTPVTTIRRYWHHRYPHFWPSLQHKVAADTVAALRELTRPTRMLPDRLLHDRTLAAVKARTRTYPPITFGDLLARVFHDWDNSHGLILEGGGVLFGDGLLEQGIGHELVVAAARAGIDDVEIAYRLGSSGSRLRGEALHRAVRSATAAGEVFRPEALIPTPAPDNPPQNWHATDIEDLWNSPIVCTADITVGMAVEDTLQVGGEVSRRLDCLGPGGFEVPNLLGGPFRRWAARKACQAYHHGFIQALARHSKATMLAIVGEEPNPAAGVARAAEPVPHILETTSIDETSVGAVASSNDHISCC